MDKQQRRINTQYNEGRHELETAINIIFDKHFGKYDKNTISRFTQSTLQQGELHSSWNLQTPLHKGRFISHQNCR
jgi:hypothetical protein